MWNSSRSLWLGNLLSCLTGAAGTFSEEKDGNLRLHRSTTNICPVPDKMAKDIKNSRVRPAFQIYSDGVLNCLCSLTG